MDAAWRGCQSGVGVAAKLRSFVSWSERYCITSVALSLTCVARSHVRVWRVDCAHDADRERNNDGADRSLRARQRRCGRGHLLQPLIGR